MGTFNFFLNIDNLIAFYRLIWCLPVKRHSIRSAGSTGNTTSVGWRGIDSISVLECFFVWGGRELILMNLSRRVPVGKSTWSKSESVIWSEESSQESFTFSLVNFTGSVVIVLSPEVIEVSGNIGIDF